MSRKRLTLNTSLRKTTARQEKIRPIGPKGANNRALDP